MVSVILLFVLGLVLICFGGDKLVDASVALARKIGIPQIVVGATIVSIGTTLPEILVSTTAAFDGSAAISAGNAFGSIICNTALIAGLTQLLRPVKKVEFGSLAWRSLFFFATILALTAYGWFTGHFDRMAGDCASCTVWCLCLAEHGAFQIRGGRNGGDGGEPGGAEEDFPSQESDASGFLCGAVVLGS